MRSPLGHREGSWWSEKLTRELGESVFNVLRRYWRGHFSEHQEPVQNLDSRALSATDSAQGVGWV